jgi:hypothetical protein
VSDPDVAAFLLSGVDLGLSRTTTE